MDPAGPKVGEGLDDDDGEEEPAEVAVCAILANNLHKGGSRGSWEYLLQGCKKKKKKEPHRVGDPRLSLEQFLRANHLGCFVCYGRKSSFQ